MGFQNAGFKILAGFDNDKHSSETYKRNVARIGTMDISELDAATIFEVTETEQIDVLMSGSPCQGKELTVVYLTDSGFSKQNKHGSDSDSRNLLVLHTARLIEEIKPKVFVLENVANLTSKRGKGCLESFYAIVSSYEVEQMVLNAASFSVPQNRERCFLVGVRTDLGLTYEPPVPQLTEANFRTVKDAIGDLPEPRKDYFDHPDFYNHSKPKLSELTVKRISLIPEGEGWKVLPEELKMDCHKAMDDSGTNSWPDVLGRLDRNKPAPTITCGCNSVTKGRYTHYSSDRGITMREAARLQSFPDDFRFFGGQKEIARQIGNSVPPLLAKAIAVSIKKMLDKM